MRRLNTRAPRIAGLLALALGAVALLAVSGVATAKDRGGDDNGRHHGRHHHHRHHHHRQFEMRQAGTISTFDASTGKLMIALLDGGTVTGLVTEGTEIKCEGADDRREASCSVASLAPGALVGEAELRLEGGSAVFEEVELGHDS